MDTHELILLFMEELERETLIKDKFTLGQTCSVGPTYKTCLLPWIFLWFDEPGSGAIATGSRAVAAAELEGSGGHRGPHATPSRLAPPT